MIDKLLIEYAKFLFDRFVGSVPEERQLQNALNDWRRLNR